jgi:DNA-binding response OmpR family regulator
MNTDLQPKKSLSRKRILKQIKENDWNPFERADGKLLERLNNELKKQTPSQFEQAPF